MAERISLLQVPVDVLTRRDLEARCRAFLRSDTLHQIVTANPEILLLAREDSAYRAVLTRAHLVVADGVGVILAARARGHAPPQRITGFDLVEDLCRLAAEGDWGAYFLGGKPGSAHKTVERLRGTLPQLRAGAFQLPHEAHVVPEVFWEELRRVRPGVLFVAYGAPTQERWIAEHAPRLESAGVRIAVGVGGVFDVLAGVVPRAPMGVRTAGLEWAWRLAWEPSRLPRILNATVRFPLEVLRDARR